MKLTKREQVLLLILITIVVFVGAFMLLFLPQDAKKQSLMLSHSEKQTEINNMKIIIADKETLTSRLDTINESIDQSASKISDLLRSETFDIFLHKLGLDFEVSIVKLSYSPDSLLKPDLNFGQIPNLPYELKEDLMKLSEDNVNQGVQYDLLHKSINVEIQGEPENLKKFADGLYTGGYKTLYLNSWSMDYKSKSAHLSLDLFSLEKIKQK